MMYTTPIVKLYESDGWFVMESRENVPAGRYEVRDPSGEIQYGIWDSLESAIAHLHEVKDLKMEYFDWFGVDNDGPTRRRTPEEIRRENAEAAERARVEEARLAALPDSARTITLSGDED